jgi:hypothetical protein
MQPTKDEWHAFKARRGATLSFYAVVDCHWLSFLRDLHTNCVVIAVFSVKMTVSPRAIHSVQRGAGLGRTVALHTTCLCLCLRVLYSLIIRSVVWRAAWETEVLASAGGAAEGLCEAAERRAGPGRGAASWPRREAILPPPPPPAARPVDFVWRITHDVYSRGWGCSGPQIRP